jgi:hypothetical protein
MAAMKILVGPTHFAKGFTLGTPARQRVLEAVSAALGWSQRNVRRHLPPYPPDWWEQREISLETVKELEQLAAKKGHLTRAARAGGRT